MNYKRTIGLAVVALASTLVVSGCAKQFLAERAGKKLGESICDLVTADSPEEADKAMEEINDQIDSLQSKYELWTTDERSEIDQTVDDLQSEISEGDRAAARDDLVQLRRLVGEAQQDSSDVTEAAIDGVRQGLESCRPG